MDMWGRDVWPSEGKTDVDVCCFLWSPLSSLPAVWWHQKKWPSQTWRVPTLPWPAPASLPPLSGPHWAPAARCNSVSVECDTPRPWVGIILTSLLSDRVLPAADRVLAAAPHCLLYRQSLPAFCKICKTTTKPPSAQCGVARWWLSSSDQNLWYQSWERRLQISTTRGSSISVW